MTTPQNLPQRNSAERHERICQESMVSKYIHDADCCREGNAFVLFSLPRELPGLFNVRFTAPVDFTPGDIFTVKGQDLAVRTRLMEEPAGVLFAAGAVVRCDIDMEQRLVFVTAGGEAQGGSENAFSSAPPLMDGTAAAGLATTAARSDHVHPTDTSRAALNSPEFVGTPTAPTAASGTATTQLATTEFVADAIADIDVSGDYAPVESPEFIGTPTAPTATSGTDTTQIATTEFVNTAIAEKPYLPAPGYAMVPDYSNPVALPKTNPQTIAQDGFISVDVTRPGQNYPYVTVNNKVIVAGGYMESIAIFPVSAGDVIAVTTTFLSVTYVPPKYIPVNRQYSTDEQLTGETWIDGKPIWRKVVKNTMNEGTKIIDTSLKEADIDTCISIVSTFYNGTAWLSLFNGSGSSYYTQGMYIIINASGIVIENNIYAAGFPVITTITYTKP